MLSHLVKKLFNLNLLTCSVLLLFLIDNLTNFVENFLVVIIFHDIGTINGVVGVQTACLILLNVELLFPFQRFLSMWR